MLEIAQLFGACFAGTILWFLASEGWAAWYGSHGWHWAAVGAICAVAQTCMYVLLYAFGARLVVWWPWFGRKIEAVHARYGARLEKAFIPLSMVGSIVGLPPATAMPVLAPGFGVPKRHILPIMLAGRFIRFSICAASGDAIGHAIARLWSAIAGTG